jgi:hypothetical protein
MELPFSLEHHAIPHRRERVIGVDALTARAGDER